MRRIASAVARDDGRSFQAKAAVSVGFATVAGMRFPRRRSRHRYDGEWTEPLFWVHPGAGVIPAAQTHGHFVVANRKLLASWWIALSEDEQDRRIDVFARDLLIAAAGSGDPRIYAELSDALGVGGLLATIPPVAEDDLRSLRFEFPATHDSIKALVMTNPGPLYLRQGQRLVLSLHDDWEAIWLHVDDPALLQSASELTRRPEPTV